MASLDEGLIVLGINNQIVHANPYVEKMLKVKLSQLKNKSIKEVIKNNLILDAIQEKKFLTDQEIVLDEADPPNNTSYLSIRLPMQPTRVLDSQSFLKNLNQFMRSFHKVAGPHAHYTFSDIWGESQEIKNVISISKTVAKSTSNILIVGESGTGKELVAQSIHNMSNRQSRTFRCHKLRSIPFRNDRKRNLRL